MLNFEIYVKNKKYIKNLPQVTHHVTNEQKEIRRVVRLHI